MGSFSFTLTFVFYCFCYKLRVLPNGLKYTGQPALKTPTFKGITLFHLYRDKKLQTEHKVCLVGGFQEHHDLTYMNRCKNKGF